MATTEQQLRKILSRNHPDFVVRSFEIVGEGLDNTAVALNHDLIVRFTKRKHNIAFLSELHSLGIEGYMDLLPLDAGPFDNILNESRDTFELAKGSIPRHFHAGIEKFFGDPLPKVGSIRTLLHKDLGDPAVDFAKIYRDLGEDGLREVFSGYQNKTEAFEDIFSRIAFYAKCSIFEEIEFGQNMGHEIYFTRAIQALSWLFPPQDPGKRS